MRIRLRIADRKDSRSFGEILPDFPRTSKIDARGSRSRLLIPISRSTSTFQIGPDRGEGKGTWNFLDFITRGSRLLDTVVRIYDRLVSRETRRELLEHVGLARDRLNRPPPGMTRARPDIVDLPAKKWSDPARIMLDRGVALKLA